MLSEFSFNNVIVGKGKSASIDFSVSSFVDKSSDGLTSWVSISNIWFNFSNHINSGFVDTDKGSIVKLSKSE